MPSITALRKQRQASLCEFKDIQMVHTVSSRTASALELWGPVDTWKSIYSLRFHFLWRWSPVCGICGSSFIVFHLCLFYTFGISSSCFEFHPCDYYFKHFLCKLSDYCKVISRIQQAPCGLNVKNLYKGPEFCCLGTFSPWTCEWQLKAPCRVIPKPPITWNIMLKNCVLSGCAGGPLAILSLPFSCLPLLAWTVIWVAEKLLA